MVPIFNILHTCKTKWGAKPPERVAASNSKYGVRWVEMPHLRIISILLQKYMIVGFYFVVKSMIMQCTD